MPAWQAPHGAELVKLPATSNDDDVPDASWPVDELADYIVRRHHSYVRQQLPVISGHLARLVDVHGDRHPELRQIAARFAELSSELQSHMLKEERVLFPYVQQLAGSAELALEPPVGLFGNVRNPIRMMEAEHRFAGDELGAIREMTSNYAVQNNILFPHAVMLEAAASAG